MIRKAGSFDLMEDPAQLVDRFFRAHTATDPGQRRDLLVGSVENTAEFHGLQVDLAGLDELIDGFVGDHHLVRTSSVDVRGSWLRWEWAYQSDDGVTATAEDGSEYAGVAIGRLGEHDRLVLIVPFLGSRPGADS